MKYYIIAGEASGDLHASNLIKEIKNLDEKAEIRAWGGDLMQQQGAHIVKHYRELAFMGFKEVILNLNTIFKNIKLCKQDIEAYKPDVLVFVDYPGFNMRIAKWAKQQGYKTVYYISPQVWAWKENRAHALKRDIDKMIVILPFEADFYKKYNYKVDYVGHPLLEFVEDYRKHFLAGTFLGNNEKPVVALLPGSRKQEISKMLPVMLKVAADFPAYKFVIAGAPGQQKSFYQPFLTGNNIEIVFNKTYELFSQAKAALVTSGTATLEAALFEVPQAVCYKGSKISYYIGRQLVKIKYISLVNLIMDKPVVRELIQDDFSEEKVKAELKSLLEDNIYRNKILADYKELKTMLGGEGASAKAAAIVYKFALKDK
ncbi:MAG: lipid-A-disaccharide synthase [Bacteroidia bacterium]